MLCHRLNSSVLLCFFRLGSRANRCHKGDVAEKEPVRDVDAIHVEQGIARHWSLVSAKAPLGCSYDGRVLQAVKPMS